MKDLEKPILHLNLKKKWFDMIESGEKTEEYRDKSPYWCRLFSSHIKIKGKFYHPSDVLICFSNGYAKDRRQMIIECENLVHREGKEEWGAEKGVFYNVLVLGKKVFPQA